MKCYAIGLSVGTIDWLAGAILGFLMCPVVLVDLPQPVHVMNLAAVTPVKLFMSMVD